MNGRAISVFITPGHQHHFWRALMLVAVSAINSDPDVILLLRLSNIFSGRPKIHSGAQARPMRPGPVPMWLGASGQVA